MPVLFSNEFDVSRDKIEELGILDIILDLDTCVFIDPALIDICEEPEFSNARAKIEKYFSNIITLIRCSDYENDMYALCNVYSCNDEHFEWKRLLILQMK